MAEKDEFILQKRRLREVDGDNDRPAHCEQRCNIVATLFGIVIVPTLSRCVALKIFVANCFEYHHI